MAIAMDRMGGWCGHPTTADGIAVNPILRCDCSVTVLLPWFCWISLGEVILAKLQTVYCVDCPPLTGNESIDSQPSILDGRLWHAEHSLW